MAKTILRRRYLADGRDFGAMNATYREFFQLPGTASGDAPPARATVRTRLMNPSLNVEIQCIVSGIQPDVAFTFRLLIAQSAGVDGSSHDSIVPGHTQE